MLLTIQGSGIVLGEQMTALSQATPSPVATVVSSLSPPPAVGEPVTNTDPDHAYALDGQVHSIAANSSLWYRFDYAGYRSQITVTLLYAANSGLAFNVYTPAQISDWWEAKPISRARSRFWIVRQISPTIWASADPTICAGSASSTRRDVLYQADQL